MYGHWTIQLYLFQYLEVNYDANRINTFKYAPRAEFLKINPCEKMLPNSYQSVQTQLIDHTTDLTQY